MMDIEVREFGCERMGEADNCFYRNLGFETIDRKNKVSYMK